MSSHLSSGRIIVVFTAAALVTGVIGCAARGGSHRSAVTWYEPSPGLTTLHPSSGQPTGPCALAMGNISLGEQPSARRQALAEFFFGETLEAGPGLVKPGAVAVFDDAILVCDAGLGAVVRCDTVTQKLSAAITEDIPPTASAVATCDNGDFVAAFITGNAVHRYDQQGRRIATFAAPPDFQPMAVAQVGIEAWVSNAARHCIEVFDARSGTHLRTLGRRGRGPGEFNMPMGIAALPSGGAAVVDSYNARVQLLDVHGVWQRDLGGPGDGVGQFGRPTAVAAGPDGTIFVLDAASQRVHAFDANSRVLLVFGRRSDDVMSLQLPGGICIAPAQKRNAAMKPRAGIELNPAYYVLVSEQLNNPGVRVYGWFAQGQ